MTPPTPTHTHLWDGSRDLPDWLTNHRWTAGQLVIRTPDGDTRPQAGWWLIGWTDGTVTTASPAVAERVYGTDGLWGRLQHAEEQLALNLAEKKQCSAQQWPQRLGEAEKAARRAEAAVARVRTKLDEIASFAERLGTSDAVAYHDAVDSIRAALDNEPPGPA